MYWHSQGEKYKIKKYIYFCIFYKIKMILLYCEILFSGIIGVTQIKPHIFLSFFRVSPLKRSSVSLHFVGTEVD